jgi:hypothetical protein
MLEGTLEIIDTYASSSCYSTTEIAKLLNIDVRIVEGMIREYLPQHGDLIDG